MGEEGFDAVSEIHIPKPDIFISAAGGEKGIIGGDIEGVDGKFMPVEFEAVFVAVGVHDVDL